MIYLEATSAFEFWTSTARTQIDVGRLSCTSELAECPATSRASAEHTLETIPCRFSRLELAVPDASMRVQRGRFSYHVHSRGIPARSFMRIAHGVYVASPAYTLVQMSQRFSVARLAQVVCEMQGSYLRMPGDRGGMVGNLSPLVTAAEIRRLIEATRGVIKTERLEAALCYARPNSASPKETELLLLLALTKRRGGAGLSGWELNPTLQVPKAYRHYLQKGALRPDVYSAQGKVDLEYVSRAEHDRSDVEHADSKRTNVLRSMGIEVIPVHPEDLACARSFESIVRQVKEARGIPYRMASEESLAARERLMAELRALPPFGYR